MVRLALGTKAVWRKPLSEALCRRQTVWQCSFFYSSCIRNPACGRCDPNDGWLVSSAWLLDFCCAQSLAFALALLCFFSTAVFCLPGYSFPPPLLSVSYFSFPSLIRTWHNIGFVLRVSFFLTDSLVCRLACIPRFRVHCVWHCMG